MADNNLPIQSVTVVSPDITTVEKNTNIQTAVLTPYNTTRVRAVVEKKILAEAEEREKAEAEAKARYQVEINNKPMMKGVEAYGQEKRQLTKEDKNQMDKLKKLYGF
jgi:hypothetical protein